MEANETEIKEEKVVDIMDQEFGLEEVVTYYDKTSLVGKSTVVRIHGLKDGNFGKPLLIIEENGMLYQLDLNVTRKNFLVANFGKKPREWVGNTIVMTGTLGNFKIKDNIVQGVVITFSLP